MKPQVKIVSDGTPHGTKVFVDGVEVRDAVAVEWTLKVGGESEATIKISPVALELHDEAAIKLLGRT